MIFSENRSVKPLKPCLNMPEYISVPTRAGRRLCALLTVYSKITIQAGIIPACFYMNMNKTFDISPSDKYN